MNKKVKQQTIGGVDQSQIDFWFAKATRAMKMELWDQVIDICKRILRYLPKKSKDRVDALSYLSNAFAMLQDFEGAYTTMSEALAISPEDPFLWYNRGLTDRYLFLIGQSVRDMEKAVYFLQDTKMLPEFKKELRVSEAMVKSELALRPEGFTLDKLIKQQEYFHQGISYMMKRKWCEAENAFRNAIRLADCLPNPQGNLGICLLMQQRLDEAEATLKRALEIDNQYDIARQNLRILEDVRNGAPLPDFRMNETFKGKLNISTTYIQG